MDGINIASFENGLGGALTNPTAMSFSKGSIKNQYPVTFRGIEYKDAETAYQQTKRKSSFMHTGELYKLMVEIIDCKFQQHPRLKTAITTAGGAEWLNVCRHIVFSDVSRRSKWEGIGQGSLFIAALTEAYKK